MPRHLMPSPPAADREAPWSVHVEFHVDGHPGDDVTQAAAAALVDELTQFSPAAFGGRGFVTLICTQPARTHARPDVPVADEAVEAALQVVSRFAPVRRIHPVGSAALR